MVRAEPPPPLLSPQLDELLGLIGDADSVELKLTVADEDRQSAVDALDIDPLEGSIRQVWFFDTPDLALDRSGVVVRARRTQDDPDDTVVKLRPVVPAELAPELREHRDFSVEVDAMPGSYVCSASFKGRAKADVREVVTERKPPSRLFSKPQRSFFADHAPDGVDLDDLAALGPVNVLKLKLSPKGLGGRLAVELWLYPDGSRILELSTKCAPPDWFETRRKARDFLDDVGVSVTGEQSTKTRAALEYFAGLLRGSS
jgi:hypothetical protein